MAYTDDDKRIALLTYASCKENATHAAKWCKEKYGLVVSADQITRWHRGDFIAPEIRSSAEEIKLSLAEKCEQVAGKLLDAILPNIDGATLVQQATAFGIVSDKMLLFRGEANQIQGMTKDEATLRLMELIGKYAHSNPE